MVAGSNKNLVWTSVLDLIKTKVESSIFDTFFASTKILDYKDQKFYISTPSALNRTILNTKYRELVNETLEVITESNFKCAFILEEEFESTESEQKVAEIANFDFVSELNSELTFENFVVGETNNEAHAAALAISSDLGAIYNPLFIYGNTGLGKTHLIHAVGNKIKNHGESSRKIKYMTSKQFVDGYIDALKEKKIKEFEQSFKYIDVLLIDDIQFLSGKDQTGITFFNIFNSLIQERKQIVLTSDKHPRELSGLEERLVSRFSSGLSIMIATPTIELAKSIIEVKIDKIWADDEVIFTAEAISYLAENNHTDIRSIEEALTRISFLLTLSSVDTVDINFVTNAFGGINSLTTKLNASKVKNAVAKHFGIDVQKLTSKSRKGDIAKARHIAVWFCREYCEMSYPQIGHQFGGRDHSTIMSSWKKISTEIDTDPYLKESINQLKGKLSIS